METIDVVKEFEQAPDAYTREQLVTWNTTKQFPTRPLYYISQGRGGKKYTLRQHFNSTKFNHYSGNVEDEVISGHVLTLGQDKEHCLNKSRAYLEYKGINPDIDGVLDISGLNDKVGKISQYEIPFGKYKGSSLENIPEQYLIWLGSGCKVKKVIVLDTNTGKTDYGWYPIWVDKLSDIDKPNRIKKVADKAKNLCIEKGLFVEHNGEWMSPDDVQRLELQAQREIEEARLKAIEDALPKNGHYGNDGERITFTVRIENIRHINISKPDYTLNMFFLHTKDAKYIYKTFNDTKACGVIWDAINQWKDDQSVETITVTATLEHTEYRCENQTILKRPKVK